MMFRGNTQTGNAGRALPCAAGAVYDLFPYLLPDFPLQHASQADEEFISLEFLS